MKYPSKIFKAACLPAVVYSVLKHISAQQKFLQQHIAPILESTYKKNDGSLSQNDLDKINRYYGLAVPAILGEAFCAWRGKGMSTEERWASTSQGAMTGLFDDFFDKDYLSDEVVEKMILHESDPADKRSNQQLFDSFYQKALQYAPDKKQLQQTLLEVYKAQVESKKQENNNIITTEIERITNYKGGSSLVFYRTAFSPAASAAEEKILYDLGGLMQLSNDIFDIYKDREAGINTLITTTTSIKETQEFYKARLLECYNNVYSSGYPRKNVREFLDILSIGIFSRCFVCLDQLEKNEKLSGNKFVVQQYTRKQLICDMDTKINMLRSAWSHITDIP